MIVFYKVTVSIFVYLKNLMLHLIICDAIQLNEWFESCAIKAISKLYDLGWQRIHFAWSHHIFLSLASLSNNTFLFAFVILMRWINTIINKALWLFIYYCLLLTNICMWLFYVYNKPYHCMYCMLCSQFLFTLAVLLLKAVDTIGNYSK